MIFYCDGCHLQKRYGAEFGMCMITGKNIFQRFCRACRSPQINFPDVYFDGKPEENLADDPNTGKPPVFLSRGQKAAYLKERNLSEAGDPVHGAPMQFSKAQPPKQDGRHEIRMTLKKIREMGQLRRRQEFLKIVHEGRNHARS